MRRAAIYCRLSVDRGGDAESPERQEAACRQAIAAKGWEVAEVFVDRDLSAFKRVARPDYDRMLKGLRDRRFDAVAVFKLDRLTRRFTDTGPIVKALQDAGAVLLSVHDNIDTSTPMGQAIMGVLVAQAETESLNTSIRVAAAAESTAKSGKPHSGGSRCFGYTRDMEIIPEEAAVGREMAERVLAGESLRQIAIDLNARGVRTTQGKDWHAGRVASWLRGPRPAGFRTHRGVELPGKWEAIIPPETRLKLIETIVARGHAGGRDTTPKHLLAGLVYCGRCGGRLKSMGFRMKNGRPFPRYQCVKAPGFPNCGGIAASEVALDARVRDEFLSFLSRTELRPLPDERHADELRRLVDEDERALLDLTRERFVKRSIGADEFEAVRSELQDRLEANRVLLDAWERDATDLEGALRPGRLEDLQAWWDAASLEERRLALSHAIRGVHVHPAKRRGGNRFDTSRVKIDWKWSLYLRAAQRVEETATPEDWERGLEEYNRLNREADAEEGT